ncbi:MAG: diaminopimelate epimerase [Promethearchaeota archaeon]
MKLENLDFEKHHGLGNDYILINNLHWGIEDDKKKDLAKILCAPHFSIGADGILFVCHPKKTEIRMKMFNPDGSEAEMCGNGIRCFAKYVYENDIIKKDYLEIETLKGIITAQLTIVEEKVRFVKINMGPPILDCDSIPVIGSGLNNQCVNESLVVLDKIFEFTAVSMGNPHAIIFIKGSLSNEQLNTYGALIESNERFPKKTNVETNSCGTGSCAAVVAGTILGVFKKNNPVTVHNDGGDLIIYYDGKKVFMEGPAEKVFEGIIPRIEF